MFIVGLCGSPRKGNSETILRLLLDDLKGLGAETELILLRRQNMGFCDSCYKCQHKQECAKSDDVSQIVHPKILEAHALIFASPSYYGSVSGQMKTFMDRCFPFLNMYTPGPLRGKYAVNVICYGRGGGIQIAQTTLDQWCMCMGMHIFDNLSFKVLKQSDAENNENVRVRLHLTAEELFKAVNLKLDNEDDKLFPRILANEEALVDKWKS